MRRRRACRWILRPRRRFTARICRRRSSHSSEATPTRISRMEFRRSKFRITSRTYRCRRRCISLTSRPGPIPAYAPVEGTSNSTGDRHVLVYLEAGDGNNPALYEMWQGIYEDGPWTDSSNALWPNVAANNLTTQGQGTSDAAGLAGGAAAGECRRGDRHGHAERAERDGSASDSLHAQPHAELLGVAGDGNGGRGQLHAGGQRRFRWSRRFRRRRRRQAAP